MIQPLNKHERRVIACLLAAWVFLLALFVPRYAYGYIDPATTTYIIQVVAALVITLSVSFSIVLYRFRMLIMKFWVRITSKQHAEADQGQEGEAAQDAQGTQGVLLKEKLAEYILEESPEPPAQAFGFVPFSEQELTALEQAQEAHNKQNASTSSSEDEVSAKKDQRSFKQRLGLAALVSAGLIFTFLIFGPLELFSASRNDMHFNLGDFIGTLLLVALVCFVVLTLVLTLLKGRVLDSLLCILTGILLASYLQTLFCNGFIGQLNGDSIPWDEYQGELILNVIMWLVIIGAFFVVRARSQKLWQGATVFVCAALIGVQLVALVSISSSITAEPNASENNLVLSREGTLELSSEQNVIVFLLDKFDKDYADRLLEKDPHFFDELDGFTRYADNLTLYSYTYPSIAYSLTGLRNDYVSPSNEYLPEAYSQHLFVDDLVEAGWTTKLYLCAGYDFQDKSLFEGRAANLVSTKEAMSQRDPVESFITSLKLVGKLDQLSGLRYAPSALKPAFWMSSGDITKVMAEARNEYTSDYMGDFLNDLEQTGLSTPSTDPQFIYYHLDGSHRPHYLGADGYRAAGETDDMTQTEGSFVIIYEYLRQLKELGLYEDATIIITADHGVKGETLASLFYKPSGSYGTPLEVSMAPVSDDNLVPTIVEQAGITSTAAAADGYTYEEVTPNNTPERMVVQHYRNKKKDFVLSIYEIEGVASNPDNWELLDREESGLDYYMKPRK